MATFRISIAGLLGIVAVIAIWLAGMRSASSLWTTAAATVTLALLLTALLAALLLDGADRAFCAGFALFAWSYLLLVNWDWVGGQFGHDLTAGLSDIAEALFDGSCGRLAAIPSRRGPIRPRCRQRVPADGQGSTDPTRQLRADRPDVPVADLRAAGGWIARGLAERTKSAPPRDAGGG